MRSSGYVVQTSRTLAPKEMTRGSILEQDPRVGYVCIIYIYIYMYMYVYVGTYIYVHVQACVCTLHGLSLSIIYMYIYIYYKCRLTDMCIYIYRKSANEETH